MGIRDFLGKLVRFGPERCRHAGVCPYSDSEECSEDKHSEQFCPYAEQIRAVEEGRPAARITRSMDDVGSVDEGDEDENFAEEDED